MLEINNSKEFFDRIPDFIKLYYSDLNNTPQWWIDAKNNGKIDPLDYIYENSIPYSGANLNIDLNNKSISNINEINVNNNIKINSKSVATQEWVTNNYNDYIHPDTHDWSIIINKPTTISGYGITDVYSQSEINTNYIPYSGAISNVNLNYKDLNNINELSFNNLMNGTIWYDLYGKRYNLTLPYYGDIFNFGIDNGNITNISEVGNRTHGSIDDLFRINSNDVQWENIDTNPFEMIISYDNGGNPYCSKVDIIFDGRNSNAIDYEIYFSNDNQSTWNQVCSVTDNDDYIVSHRIDTWYFTDLKIVVTKSGEYDKINILNIKKIQLIGTSNKYESGGLATYGENKFYGDQKIHNDYSLYVNDIKAFYNDTITFNDNNLMNINNISTNYFDIYETAYFRDSSNSDRIEIKNNIIKSINSDLTLSSDDMIYISCNNYIDVNSKIIFDEISNIKYTTPSSSYNIEPQTNHVMNSPLTHITWHDILAFNNRGEPILEKSKDGTSWTTEPSGTATKQPFNQKESQTVTLLDDTKLKARYTWGTDDNSFPYSQAKWLVIGFKYGTDSGTRILYETSGDDGVTWNVRHDSTTNVYYTYSFHYISSYGGDKLHRLTIENSGIVKISNIQLLSMRPGNQGKGIEYEFPYNWDSDRNIILYNNLSANDIYADKLSTPNSRTMMSPNSIKFWEVVDEYGFDINYDYTDNKLLFDRISGSTRYNLLKLRRDQHIIDIFSDSFNYHDSTIYKHGDSTKYVLSSVENKSDSTTVGRMFVINNNGDYKYRWDIYNNDTNSLMDNQFEIYKDKIYSSVKIKSNDKLISNNNGIELYSDTGDIKSFGNTDFTIQSDGDITLDIDNNTGSDNKFIITHHNKSETLFEVDEYSNLRTYGSISNYHNDFNVKSRLTNTYARTHLSSQTIDTNEFTNLDIEANSTNFTKGNVRINSSYKLQTNSIDSQTDGISFNNKNLIDVGNIYSNSNLVATETWVNNNFNNYIHPDNHDWNILINTPTTVSGYGITDVYTKSEIDTNLNNYILKSSINSSNGVAGLDENTKIPVSLLPDSIINQLSYKGSWDASTDTPTLPPASESNGDYYIVSVSGTYNSIEYNPKDWIVSNGTSWEKIDNTDSVVSIFGRKGIITAQETDYESFYPKLSLTYDNPNWINTLNWSKITNKPTTLSGYGITDVYTQTQINDNYIPYEGAYNPINLNNQDVSSVGHLQLNPDKNFTSIGNQYFTISSEGSIILNLDSTSTYFSTFTVTHHTGEEDLLKLNEYGDLYIKGLIFSDDNLIATQDWVIEHFTHPATHDWSVITNTPTTISGYGITDVYTKSEIDNLNSDYLKIISQSDLSEQLLYRENIDRTNVNEFLFTGINFNFNVDNKPSINYETIATETWVSNNFNNYIHPATHDWDILINTPTTVSGYGITDVYTKSEIDTNLNNNYIPYSGATSDINLNNKNISNLNSIGVSGNIITSTDVSNLTDTNAQLAELHTDGSPEFKNIIIQGVQIHTTQPDDKWYKIMDVQFTNRYQYVKGKIDIFGRSEKREVYYDINTTQSSDSTTDNIRGEINLFGEIEFLDSELKIVANNSTGLGEIWIRGYSAYPNSYISRYEYTNITSNWYQGDNIVSQLTEPVGDQNYRPENYWILIDGYIKTDKNVILEGGTFITSSIDSYSASSIDFNSNDLTGINSVTIGGSLSATETWVTSQGYITSEIDTLQSVTVRGNTTSEGLVVKDYITPTTGNNLEMLFSATSEIGIVQAINRDTSTYLPINLNGSEINLQKGPVSISDGSLDIGNVVTTTTNKGNLGVENAIRIGSSSDSTDYLFISKDHISKPTGSFSISELSSIDVPDTDIFTFYCYGEEYDTISSSKYQYSPKGTNLKIINSNVGVDTGNLIDFNAKNSSGVTTSGYIGVKAGTTANGPANIVFGRRTGTTSWSESARIDIDGNFTTNNHIESRSISVNKNTNGNDINSGLSLYNDNTLCQQYGIQFLKTNTSNYGTHGSVTGNWAVYFNINNESNRGWIFRNCDTQNVASIDNTGDLSIGNITTNGTIKENGNRVYSPNNEVSTLYREDTLDEKIIEARYNGLHLIKTGSIFSNNYYNFSTPGFSAPYETAVSIDSSNNLKTHRGYIYENGNRVATQDWVQDQGYITSTYNFSLQDITNNGNTTNNSILISDSNNIPSSGKYLQLYYSTTGDCGHIRTYDYDNNYNLDTYLTGGDIKINSSFIVRENGNVELSDWNNLENIKNIEFDKWEKGIQIKGAGDNDYWYKIANITLADSSWNDTEIRLLLIGRASSCELNLSINTDNNNNMNYSSFDLIGSRLITNAKVINKSSTSYELWVQGYNYRELYYKVLNSYNRYGGDVEYLGSGNNGMISSNDSSSEPTGNDSSKDKVAEKITFKDGNINMGDFSIGLSDDGNELQIKKNGNVVGSFL